MIKIAPCSLKEILRIAINLSDFDYASLTLSRVLELKYPEEYGYEISLLNARLLKEQTKLEEALELIKYLEDELPKNSNLMGRILQLKSNIYLMTGNTGVIGVAKGFNNELLNDTTYATNVVVTAIVNNHFYKQLTGI